MSYCQAISQIAEKNRHLHQHYHDTQYGFPIHDDNELFGRLILEINQAGLSWETILKKQEHFTTAYSNFEIHRVAQYTEVDKERLLNDAGIIRNRLKINAAIENARTIIQLQKEWGSFIQWIEHHHPLSVAEWTKLFKKTFKFTGGEIVREFLTSIGVLPHAHDEACPIFQQTINKKPLWLDNTLSHSAK